MLLAMAMLLADAQFSAAVSAACSQHDVMSMTPGDRLQRLDDFRASLPTADRLRLDRALPRDGDGGIASCARAEGSQASCEAAAYMPALRSTGLMPKFLAALCPPVPASAAAVARPALSERLQEREVVLARFGVPSAFRGHWSVDLRDCGQPATEDTQLWITATTFNFYETNGRVVRVVERNPERAALTVRSTGEGRVFVSREKLTLSPDHASLTVRGENDASSMTYNRCAAEEMAPTFTPHHTMPPR